MYELSENFHSLPVINKFEYFLIHLKDEEEYFNEEYYGGFGDTNLIHDGQFNWFDEDNVPYEDAKKIASELVAYLNEVSQIVDFFNKPDEIRRLKRKINDLILQTDHSDQDLINNITESFMDLARHKYA